MRDNGGDDSAHSEPGYQPAVDLEAYDPAAGAAAASNPSSAVNAYKTSCQSVSSGTPWEQVTWDAENGGHDQVFDIDLSLNGHLTAQFINFEPNDFTDTGKAVIRKSRRGWMQIHCLSVNGFSGLNSVGDIYALDNGNNFIGHIQNQNDVTVNGSPIRLTGENDWLSWYFGHSSDVSDEAITSEGNFRILDTAGTGKG